MRSVADAVTTLLGRSSDFEHDIDEETIEAWVHLLVTGGLDGGAYWIHWSSHEEAWEELEELLRLFGHQKRLLVLEGLHREILGELLQWQHRKVPMQLEGFDVTDSVMKLYQHIETTGADLFRHIRSEIDVLRRLVPRVGELADSSFQDFMDTVNHVPVSRRVALMRGALELYERPVFRISPIPGSVTMKVHIPRWEEFEVEMLRQIVHELERQAGVLYVNEALQAPHASVSARTLPQDQLGPDLALSDALKPPRCSFEEILAGYSHLGPIRIIVQDMLVDDGKVHWSLGRGDLGYLIDALFNERGDMISALAHFNPDRYLDAVQWFVFASKKRVVPVVAENLANGASKIANGKTRINGELKRAVEQSRAEKKKGSGSD